MPSIKTSNKTNYKGDSPAKKVVRFKVWDLIADQLDAKGRALVLAGPEGADIGVALSLGFTPKQLTAVDNNKKCITATKWRYPQVRALHADVRDLVERESFNFIFLDLCGPLTEDSLKTAAHVAVNGLKATHGYLAFTFMCGRESPASPIHKAIFTWQAAMSKDRNKQRKKTIAQRSRMKVVQSNLLRLVRKSNCVIVPKEFWFYQSEVGDGELPMGVFLCQVLPANRYAKDSSGTEANQANPLMHMVSGADLPSVASAVLKRGIDPTLGLNASKGTVAAWKAHATRGTYG